MVVGIQHTERAVRLRRRSHRSKSVLGIVGVGENAIVGQVTVGVVEGSCLRRAGDSAPYHGVLVEVVGGVGVGGGVRRRPEAVADGVVGVTVEVQADCRGGKLGTVVVQPFAQERDGVRRVGRAVDEIVPRRIPVDGLGTQGVITMRDEFST